MKQESNKNYASFAAYYDMYISEFDLSEWFSYLHSIRELKGSGCCRILDCGCGSGAFSVMFAEKEYDVTAVDISNEMLTLADSRAFDRGVKIKFLRGDISNFFCEEKYGFIYSACDTVNYLHMEELKNFMKNSYEMLLPGAALTFDMLGENISMHEKYRLYPNIDIEFSRNKNDSCLSTNIIIHDSGKTIEENHIQYIYDNHVIEKAAIDAGFDECLFYDMLTFSPSHVGSQKVQAVLLKK